MQIIQNWLNGGKNFIVGRALYKSLGSDENLKAILQKGETLISKKLLFEALQAFDAAPIKSKPLTAANKEAAQMQPMPAGDDAVLASLKNEWHPLYQRMNLLRHELDKYDNSNSKEAIEWRKPRTREIKQLEQQCMLVWDKRDYYLKHGTLPFVVQKDDFEVPADPVERVKLEENIKRYIRRYAGHMKKQPGEAKYAQLHEEYKVRFKKLTGGDYYEK